MTNNWQRLSLSITLGTAVACADAAAAEPTGPAPTTEARTAAAEAESDSASAGMSVDIAYSEIRAPCRDRHPTRWAYFGDFHVHTSLSFDAYLFENRNGPDAAYRYAKGRAIQIPDVNGTQTARIDRPLDFAAVTDHSEFLGEVDLCTTPGSVSFDTEPCRTYRESNLVVAFAGFGARLADPSPSRDARICGVGDVNCTLAAAGPWREVQRAAEAHYDRTAACRFTTFVGYEWTGTTQLDNLHRNVIFRNNQVPQLPVSYFEEPTPEGLWNRLDTVCTDQGGQCDVVAIPHNSNGSGGEMFDVEYGGAVSPADKRRVAEQRARLEPLMEVYQHKGSSECAYPGFTYDEQCAFELVQDVSEDQSGPRTPEPQDFLRGALAQGLIESQTLGVNPFALGVIASTDTHNSTPGAVQETGWQGHTGITDAIVARSNDTFSPGGLVGIWAVENSRDALFDAMKRKETFGTSGPRIRPRFFGGWSFAESVCNDPNLLEAAYANGVPMGGTLRARPGAGGGAPQFILHATNDDTLLQVAQIIKIDLLSDGTTREQVFEVAGDINNGASVDERTCRRSGPGETILCGMWTDPDFDPNQPAVYYMRVVENPSCRWLTETCNALPPLQQPAQCRQDNYVGTVQERAWTSPIWYIPPSS